MVTELRDGSEETGQESDYAEKSPYQAVLDMFEDLGVTPPENDRGWSKQLDEAGGTINISRHRISNPETGLVDVEAFEISHSGGVSFTITRGGVARLRLRNLSVVVGTSVATAYPMELIVNPGYSHPIARDKFVKDAGVALVGWVERMIVTNRYQECPIRVDYGMTYLQS